MGLPDSLVLLKGKASERVVHLEEGGMRRARADVEAICVQRACQAVAHRWSLWRHAWPLHPRRTSSCYALNPKCGVQISLRELRLAHPLRTMHTPALSSIMIAGARQRGCATLAAAAAHPRNQRTLQHRRNHVAPGQLHDHRHAAGGRHAPLVVREGGAGPAGGAGSSRG